MNSTLQFYKALTGFLGNSSNISFVRKDVLRLASACIELTWIGTDESLTTLHECIHRVSDKYDDTYESILEQFIIVAFKDLSVQRDPAAMGMFERLQRTCGTKSLGHFVWPRKIIERKDGSAVIVLHVSDLRQFEEILDSKAERGYFLRGMMICGLGKNP